MIALLLLALLSPPKAAFTYSCYPSPALTCLFTADSIPAARYSWNWGDGRSESHSQPMARNAWAKPGIFVVRLIVTDAKGKADTTAQSVTLPAYTVFDTTRIQLPPIQLPGRVDTLRIQLPTVHDTIQLPAPPAVHDTTVVTLPAVHDTVQLPAPPAVHDTTVVRIPVHDTTIVQLPGRVDTLRIITLVPQPPTTAGRSVVVTRNGEFMVYQGPTLIGQLWPVDLNLGTWRAYSVQAGSSIMPCVGIASGCTVFVSQDAARDGLP